MSDDAPPNEPAETVPVVITAEAVVVNATEVASGDGDDVEVLVASVKERGFVTTGEIFAALPRLEPDTAELAAIYTGIQQRGIEVVDEIAEELAREDQRRAGGDTSTDARPHRQRGSELGRSTGVVNRPGDGPRSRRPARAGSTGRPSAWNAAGETGSFDPVRMYLKEIGKVPLLTAAQEVTLAKRIEAGLHAVARIEELPSDADEARASLDGHRHRR